MKAQTILQSQLCLLCRCAAFDAVAKTRVDYSRFSHLTEKHKLECQTGHKFPSPNWQAVRKEDAFPDIAEFPDHHQRKERTLFPISKSLFRTISMRMAKERCHKGSTWRF
jgi:hypothetical protein